jgi:diguanylate cyclase
LRQVGNLGKGAAVGGWGLARCGSNGDVDFDSAGAGLERRAALEEQQQIGAITLVAFIFVTGVFNFVLGYFLALVLADPPLAGLLSGAVWRNVWRGLLRRQQEQPAAEEEEFASGEDTAAAESGPTLPAVAPVTELPEHWQHALRDNGLLLDTLAMGVAHFLRLESAVYREHLLTAEARARQAIAVSEPPLLEQLSADLRFINVDWSRKLRQAADHLEDRAGRLGPAEEPALKLAALLRDQGAQIAEIDREVHGLNFRAEGSNAGRRMLGEMHQLIHLAHSLRDGVLRILAAICRSEEALEKVDRKLHYDAATGLLGRVGLEALFAGEFKTGSKPAVAMRISLDRFAKVNQRLGARAGDQAIKAMSRYLAELTAAKCEKSLLARQDGGDFLLLAQEATVEEVAAVGEHIRQSFEAASFSYQGTDFCLTLTISVVAVAADADLDSVLERLAAARGAALKAGQNRSSRWENGAAVLSLPPAIPVAAKLIAVETVAA